MPVAVKLGSTAFDFSPLTIEQRRLGNKLIKPAAKDFLNGANGLSFTRYQDTNIPPIPPGTPGAVVGPDPGDTWTKFDLYIKVFWDADADKVKKNNLPYKDPVYRLCYKDDTNKETQLQTLAQYETLGWYTNTAGPARPIEFDLERGIVFLQTGAPGSGYNQPVDPLNPNVATEDIPVGVLKLDAVTGLELGQLNTRITEVNQAIEGMSKVLSVVSSTLDAALNIIR